MYSNGFKTVKKGDHVLAVFREEDQPYYAIDFLKTGLERNERVILMMDSVAKNVIRDKIKKEDDIEDLETLEAQNQIIIKTSDELIQWDSLHKEKSNFWRQLTNQAIKDGKSGLRVFTDTSGFFKKETTDKLIQFESSLEKIFDFPCIVLCAYTMNNVRSLNHDQNQILIDHHKSMWI